MKMRGRLLWIVTVVALAPMVGKAERPASSHKYVGAAKCKTCHKKELMGDQYGEWKKGEHAKAYETLKGEKAAEIAKKKGLSTSPHETEECLQCHVTAYGLPASAFDKKKPLKNSDGIQCESCHGPGKDYRKKKIMSDRDKAIAKGMWEPGKDEQICTACHNADSPTWDTAKGFDHEKAMEEIAHPIPEDVKGKYLEMAEKLRAERGESGDDEEEDED